jgi:hypothetical protein
MTVSDAPSYGNTYDHHSENSRGVIYNLNIFITQATGEIKWEKDHFINT